jgi:hypothetical protein
VRASVVVSGRWVVGDGCCVVRGTCLMMIGARTGVDGVVENFRRLLGVFSNSCSVVVGGGGVGEFVVVARIDERGPKIGWKWFVGF